MAVAFMNESVVSSSLGEVPAQADKGSEPQFKKNDQNFDAEVVMPSESAGSFHYSQLNSEVDSTGTVNVQPKGWNALKVKTLYVKSPITENKLSGLNRDGLEYKCLRLMCVAPRPQAVGWCTTLCASPLTIVGVGFGANQVGSFAAGVAKAIIVVGGAALVAPACGLAVALGGITTIMAGNHVKEKLNSAGKFGKEEAQKLKNNLNGKLKEFEDSALETLPDNLKSTNGKYSLLDPVFIKGMEEPISAREFADCVLTERELPNGEEASSIQLDTPQDEKTRLDNLLDKFVAWEEKQNGKTSVQAKASVQA